MAAPEIRDGQIDPDGRLDAQHQNDRQQQLTLHEQQDQEHRADGQQIHLDHVGVMVSIRS